MNKFTRGKVAAILQYFAVFSVVILISTSFFPQTLGEGWGSYTAPTYGDWFINNTTSISNEVIILTGNMTIGSNGTVTLENVTLKMNLTDEGAFGINITPGGTLNILNSTITTN